MISVGSFRERWYRALGERNLTAELESAATADEPEPTVEWRCPCIRCPACRDYRGPGHPDDGAATCYGCGHQWTVAIGSNPGQCGSTRDIYELMQLFDDDMEATQ